MIDNATASMLYTAGVTHNFSLIHKVNFFIVASPQLFLYQIFPLLLHVANTLSHAFQLAACHLLNKISFRLTEAWQFSVYTPLRTAGFTKNQSR